jgi:hypothetical protein
MAANLGGVTPDEIVATQREVCARYGADPVPAPLELKAGVAANLRDGLLPINGLRHQPEPGTTGWFIWAGTEPSDDGDFFKPLHVAHLIEWCPAVIRFLQLPPGYRFQVAPDHEDVWRDPSLLDV